MRVNIPIAVVLGRFLSVRGRQGDLDRDLLAEALGSDRLAEVVGVRGVSGNYLR